MMASEGVCVEPGSFLSYGSCVWTASVSRSHQICESVKQMISFALKTAYPRECLSNTQPAVFFPMSLSNMWHHTNVWCVAKVWVKKQLKYYDTAQTYTITARLFPPPLSQDSFNELLPLESETPSCELTLWTVCYLCLSLVSLMLNKCIIMQPLLNRISLSFKGFWELVKCIYISWEVIYFFYMAILQ